MPMFEIIEVDRDYRTISGIEDREFVSKEAADKWCEESSWTGYRYFVSNRPAIGPHSEGAS
ncbi:hypothetical protein AB7M43_008445 [Bradyrhizobium elkanii]